MTLRGDARGDAGRQRFQLRARVDVVNRCAASKPSVCKARSEAETPQ
jgi:hypothetical protein